MAKTYGHTNRQILSSPKERGGSEFPKHAALMESKCSEFKTIRSIRAYLGAGVPWGSETTLHRQRLKRKNVVCLHPPVPRRLRGRSSGPP
nr:hypothetical protein PHYPA_014368 [Physcomitrium patens]